MWSQIKAKHVKMVSTINPIFFHVFFEIIGSVYIVDSTMAQKVNSFHSFSFEIESVKTCILQIMRNHG